LLPLQFGDRLDPRRRLGASHRLRISREEAIREHVYRIQLIDYRLKTKIISASILLGITEESWISGEPKCGA
jgi:hypothetical protein